MIDITAYFDFIAVSTGLGYDGDGGSPKDAQSNNPTHAYWDGTSTWVTEVCVVVVFLRFLVYAHVI